MRTSVSYTEGRRGLDLARLSLSPLSLWLEATDHGSEPDRTADSSMVVIQLSIHLTLSAQPMRRLNLPVGREAMVSAAWLRFPDFELERLEQIYSRVDERTYGCGGLCSWPTLTRA
jgi:hypothetical protein